MIVGQSDREHVHVGEDRHLCRERIGHVVSSPIHRPEKRLSSVGRGGALPVGPSAVAVSSFELAPDRPRGQSRRASPGSRRSTRYLTALAPLSVTRPLSSTVSVNSSPWFASNERFPTSKHLFPITGLTDSILVPPRRFDTCAPAMAVNFSRSRSVSSVRTPPADVLWDKRGLEDEASNGGWWWSSPSRWSVARCESTHEGPRATAPIASIRRSSRHSASEQCVTAWTRRQERRTRLRRRHSTVIRRSCETFMFRRDESEHGFRTLSGWKPRLGCAITRGTSTCAPVGERLPF